MHLTFIIFFRARYAESTRETLLNAPGPPQGAMLQSLCSLWKSPNPAKMVPVAPSFVREIVSSCTSCAASQRPAFEKIAADLIAGPVRRFSAVHQGSHARARLMPSRSSLSVLGKGRRAERAEGRRHSTTRHHPAASTYATITTSSQDVQVTEDTSAAAKYVRLRLRCCVLYCAGLMLRGQRSRHETGRRFLALSETIVFSLDSDGVVFPCSFCTSFARLFAVRRKSQPTRTRLCPMLRSPPPLQPLEARLVGNR